VKSNQYIQERIKNKYSVETGYCFLINYKFERYYIFLQEVSPDRMLPNTFLACIWEHFGSDLSQDTNSPYTQDYCGFPQSLWANARLVHQLRPDNSPQSPIKFITHPAI
jgi:hypothetical protein